MWTRSYRQFDTKIYEMHLRAHWIFANVLLVTKTTDTKLVSRASAPILFFSFLTFSGAKKKPRSRIDCFEEDSIIFCVYEALKNYVYEYRMSSLARECRKTTCGQFMRYKNSAYIEPKFIADYLSRILWNWNTYVSIFMFILRNTYIVIHTMSRICGCKIYFYIERRQRENGFEK